MLVRVWLGYKLPKGTKKPLQTLICKGWEKCGRRDLNFYIIVPLLRFEPP